MVFTKLKLGILAVALVVVIGIIIWINALRMDNLVLETKNKNLDSTIVQQQAIITEVSRRSDIINVVTKEYETKRNSNTKALNEEYRKTQDEVQKGNDKPVGGILSDFFN